MFLFQTISITKFVLKDKKVEASRNTRFLLVFSYQGRNKRNKL